MSIFKTTASDVAQQFRIRVRPRKRLSPTQVPLPRPYLASFHPPPHMDIINVLPSPPQFFRLFLTLALSLFNSTINARHRRTLAGHSPAAFDVDSKTGFFPRQPLPKLPHAFDIWEDALRNANGHLSLGEDESETALAKRAFGERWRDMIQSVCALSLSIWKNSDIFRISGQFSILRFYTLTSASPNEHIMYLHGSLISTCIRYHHQATTLIPCTYQSPLLCLWCRYPVTLVVPPSSHSQIPFFGTGN